MGPAFRGRGQISLEFLLIFGVLMIMLVYSVRVATFAKDSPSVDVLRVQVALEEKSLADVISGTINQVYAQGPGSKATGYAKLFYLRNPDYLEKAWGVKEPRVLVTYGSLGVENGTCVAVVNGTGTTTLIPRGGDKNVLCSPSLYSRNLLENGTVWNGTGVIVTVNGTGRKIYGLVIAPSNIPPVVKITVEWNPDEGEAWEFNETAGEIRININPGG